MVVTLPYNKKKNTLKWRNAIFFTIIKSISQNRFYINEKEYIKVIEKNIGIKYKITEILVFI